MKKSKPNITIPSLFGEDVSTSFEPIKELKLKKIEVAASSEQTLFDIPALPVQVRKPKQKHVEDAPQIKSEPFEHEKYGLSSIYNLDNPNTVLYYENLKKQICEDNQTNQLNKSISFLI